MDVTGAMRVTFADQEQLPRHTLEVMATATARINKRVHDAARRGDAPFPVLTMQEIVEPSARIDPCAAC